VRIRKRYNIHFTSMAVANKRVSKIAMSEQESILVVDAAQALVYVRDTVVGAVSTTLKTDMPVFLAPLHDKLDNMSVQLGSVSSQSVAEKHDPATAESAAREVEVLRTEMLWMQNLHLSLHAKEKAHKELMEKKRVLREKKLQDLEDEEEEEKRQAAIAQKIRAEKRKKLEEEEDVEIDESSLI
jgi:hypothetical protein